MKQGQDPKAQVDGELRELFDAERAAPAMPQDARERVLHKLGVTVGVPFPSGGTPGGTGGGAASGAAGTGGASAAGSTLLGSWKTLVVVAGAIGVIGGGVALILGGQHTEGPADRAAGPSPVPPASSSARSPSPTPARTVAVAPRATPSSAAAPPSEPAAFAAEGVPATGQQTPRPLSSQPRARPRRGGIAARPGARPTRHARRLSHASAHLTTPDAGARSADVVGHIASTLAAERQLLDRARAALKGGKTEIAREVLARHARRFAQGTLVEERQALEILALARAGERPLAVRLARRFRRRYPRSLLLSAIEAGLRSPKP